MRRPRSPMLLFLGFYLLLWGPASLVARHANAQVDPNPGISQEDLQRLAAEAADENSDVESSDTSGLGTGSINFLNLLIKGGWLMIPIAVMSLLVVAFTLERVFALRSGKIFPRPVKREIRTSIEDPSPAGPPRLFDVAERYPSAASRVLCDALSKVGRPVPEIESAIGEGIQREADHLYGNVRWLTLAAAVTPLIGLLGTVWGMIIAFYNTTKLGSGSNKADFLAEGIYVALVTTLGGLAVAIPAAIFAHYFEGKITKILSKIETDLRNLVPRFESLEGKARYDMSKRGLTRRVLPDGESGAGIATRPMAGGHEVNAPTPPPARPPAART